MKRDLKFLKFIVVLSIVGVCVIVLFLISSAFDTYNSYGLDERSCWNHRILRHEPLVWNEDKEICETPYPTSTVVMPQYMDNSQELESQWILGVKKINKTETVKVDEYCDEESKKNLEKWTEIVDNWGVCNSKAFQLINGYPYFDEQIHDSCSEIYEIEERKHNGNNFRCKAQDNDGDGYAVVQKQYWIDVWNGTEEDIWKYANNGWSNFPSNMKKEKCFLKENRSSIVKTNDYCKTLLIRLESRESWTINKEPTNVHLNQGQELCLETSQGNGTWIFRNGCYSSTGIVVAFDYKDCYDLDPDNDGYIKITEEVCQSAWIREREVE